jgi:hypothetical protein
MDHERLNAARLQPARQPKTISARFEGNDSPRNRSPGLDRLIAPSLNQLKQRVVIGAKLFHRVAIQPGHNPSHNPVR